jgi:hypothetical protein
MEPEPTEDVIRRFYIICSAIGAADLLALLPLLVVREPLLYIIIWLGVSAITWSIVLMARSRLYNRMSAARVRILAPVIAVVGGLMTALTAIVLRK